MLNNARNYENVLVYAQYLSGGLMKELVHRIAEKEGKSLREVMKEMGMSTGTIYKPLGEDAKRKILEKAFEVLDPEEVLLEIFYDIRAIYGRVIRDILEIAKDETKEEILKNYNDIGIEKIEQYLTIEELKYASDIKPFVNANTILSNILSYLLSTNGIEKIHNIEQHRSIVEELKHASYIKSSFNIYINLSNILSRPSSTEEQALKPKSIIAYRGR
ncbi:hypothetical protein DDW01_00680 [Sulfolobus sp. SCGC AB-777_G05]|nr:hypothetical protein DDW01_00680 [Sulfolobus sp. SCGC AB-777_G05]